MKKIIFALLSTSLLLQTCVDKKAASEINADEDFNSSKNASVYLLKSRWENQDGKIMELKDLEGKVVVLAMMFTSCRASCPRLVADVQRIEKRFNIEALKNLDFVLCTIDPDFDTPERLKVYAVEHSLPLTHWTLITSSQENIREISAILGVKYRKTSPIEFSHSNVISLFTKKGELYYQQEGIENDNETIVEKINFLLQRK